MTQTIAPRTITIEGMALPLAESGNVQFPCTRCGFEDGYIACYRHVEGGVCFKCRGAGGPWVTQQEAAKRLRRRAQQKASRERKREAERLAKLAEREETLADPALAGLAEAAEHNGFLASMLSAIMEWGHLTDRQYDAAVRVLTQHRERQAKRAATDAAMVDAPLGTQTVVGRIATIKVEQNDYDPYGSTVTKMLVIAELPDGGRFKVYGTMPAALRDAGVDTGDRVRFTANLELSKTKPDATFAIAKRARKAEKIVPLPRPALD